MGQIIDLLTPEQRALNNAFAEAEDTIFLGVAKDGTLILKMDIHGKESGLEILLAAYEAIDNSQDIPD